MAKDRINVDGIEYISMDSLVQSMVELTISCSAYEEALAPTENEIHALRYADLLLGFIRDREAYDAFVRSYVHQKYPMVFPKHEES